MKPNITYNNILVFNPAFMGDTVLTTPLIRMLKKLYPKANIFFCVRPEHVSLFEGLSLITKVIPFDKRGKFSGMFGVLRFAEYLKSYSFDLVINLHKSLRSTVLCSRLKPACVIGFKSAVFSSLFTHCVERVESLQEPERNLMTIAPIYPDFSLHEAKKLAGGLICTINENIVSKVHHYFAKVTGSKKIVGIAPGSVWNTKKYPAEYFAAVARTLYDNGYAIALFGSSADNDATNAFISAYNGEYYDFTSITPLRELPSILAAINLLIVNDSGPMHIAIAAGVPCLAIFGPTTRELGFFPYDTKSKVVENNHLKCRPCGKHGGNRCPQGHFKCMKDILPSTVANAALSLLQRKNSR